MVKTARLVTEELWHESMPDAIRGGFQAHYLRHLPAMLGLVRAENARPV